MNKEKPTQYSQAEHVIDTKDKLDFKTSLVEVVWKSPFQKPIILD